MKKSNLAALASLAIITSPAHAAITVLNDTFRVLAGPGGPQSTTISFDAGATADKLIVTLGSETAGAGFGGIVLTYDGIALSPVSGTNGNKNKGIWYLDNPFQGGNANLVVDVSSYTVVNGFAFGVLSIEGSAPGVDTGSQSTGLSVDLTPSQDDSLVVTNYTSNSGFVPEVPSGHTQIYTSGNIGSADGASAYLNGVAAGTQTFTYTQGNNPSANNTSGAVFAPAAAPIPEPSSLSLLGLGGLALILRRRK